jgi:hypothetical protein
MSIHFPCPECGEPVHANAALVGLHTRCPGCYASVTVPETSAPRETMRRHLEPHEHVAHEWDAPPPPSRYERMARVPQEDRWRLVRVGLLLEFIAVLMLLFATLGVLGLACLGILEVFPRGRRGDMGLAMLIGLSAVVLTGIQIIALLMIVAARSIYCAVPSSAGGGAKPFAIVSVSALGGVALCALLMAFVSVLESHRPDPPPAFFVVLALGGLCLLASHIFGLLFLRGVAAYFGNSSLAARIIMFLIVSVVLPILVVGGLVVLDLTMRRGMARGADIAQVLVVIIVATLIYAWYAGLLKETRDLIGAEVGPARADYYG